MKNGNESNKCFKSYADCNEFDEVRCVRLIISETY